MASQYPDLALIALEDGFTLSYQARPILHHTRQAPCLWIGTGAANIEMFRGNFSIKDQLNEKIALTDVTVQQLDSGWRIHFSRGDTAHATLTIKQDDDGRLQLDLHNDNASHNRIWLRLAAKPEDHTYAGGEVTVRAPLGQPPVFYRAESEWQSQFAQLRTLASRG
ncbi:TPA: hypothetical protein L9T63_004131 [Klebsiella pneumoniae]|nr:hypothetical protein [Klebsiella pneumoniae]